MIIICPNEVKREYLKNSKIHFFKFYSLEEIKAKVFFSYSKEILYVVSKKYHVLPSIAKKMLESLYYINNEETDKLKKLFSLKTYLLNNNYIIKNPYFLNSLHDDILIEGYPRSKELDIIINILSKYTNVKYKELEKKYELKEIYEFNNSNEEIRFVAESILNLINQGIDINKIVIINSNNDYIGIINKTFNLFNIPFNLNLQKKITLYKETKEFLKNIKDSSLRVSELNEELNIIKNDEVKAKIINVLNKYFNLKNEVKDLYEIIKYELEHTYVDNPKYKNVVNIYQNIRLFDINAYVFCISCNEENILKDNDYLADFEKELINLNTSFELNEINGLHNYNILSNIKNLTLSYKKSHNDSLFIMNHLFDNLEIKGYEFLNNSSNYNKYLFENDSYDNTYSKIDVDDLNKYIDKINLSASSLDIFFKCKFRFYLNNILKVEVKEDTMAIKIGNMLHEILEHVLKCDFKDYLEIIDEVSKNYLNNNLKEKFYKEKLKKEAIKIIERLKEISERTDFKNDSYEKYLELNLSKNIKLVGFIDKILTFSDGINTYIIVVDYKTGSYTVDLKKIQDGFNMQLLIYLYLIKKNYKDVKLAGAYIDQILKELSSFKYGKKYSEIIDNRIYGLTINKMDIVKHIDKSCFDKSFIKGLRITKEGEFYSNASVYSEGKINEFLDIIETKLNEALTSIKEADFKINPKKYSKKDEIVGCTYCPFKEICYMNYKDIEVLEGGEDDEANA